MQALCQFEPPGHAFRQALRLAKNVGGESRASIVASNFAASCLFRGDYRSAIELTMLSLELATKASNQPAEHVSRANLALVYALTGEKDSARKWLDRAYTCETRERSWEATMDL